MTSIVPSVFNINMFSVAKYVIYNIIKLTVYMQLGGFDWMEFCPRGMNEEGSGKGDSDQGRSAP
jgi:hypothetical protein